MVSDRCCSCCSSLGVRYDFIVLSAARPRNDVYGDFVTRLAMQDQTHALAKLRHAHR
jgi:hypothetical protein